MGHVKKIREEDREVVDAYKKQIVKQVLLELELVNISDFCKDHGVSRSMLYRWKKGCRPTLEQLDKVAKVLGIELNVKPVYKK